MKLVSRTYMTKHTMPVKAWPRWTFELWSLGCADCMVTEPEWNRQDLDPDSVIPHWKYLIWRIRGPILRAVFEHLWWWV